MIGYVRYEDCWFFYNLHLVHYPLPCREFFYFCGNFSLSNRGTDTLFSRNLCGRSAHLCYDVVSHSSVFDGRNEISLTDSCRLHTAAQFQTTLHTKSPPNRHDTKDIYSHSIWSRSSEGLCALFIRNPWLVTCL